jgi:phosphotransferase system enzyme I (PtsI)
VWRGIPVSPGVRRGKLLVLDRPAGSAIPRLVLPPGEAPRQLARLQEALVQTRREIQEVQRQVSERLAASEAGIFDAHLAALDDPMLIEEVSRQITEEHLTAEYAFQQTADKFARTLGAMADEYLRERASDMRDLAGRVLNHLTGRAEDGTLRRLTEPCLVVAHDLSPTQTAQLDKRFVLGFATDIGGKTSHTAIMARALRIPAVVGLQNASHTLASGQYALLDGYNGQLILNPTEQTLFEYGQLDRKRVTLEERLRDAVDQPAVTLDNARITVSANVEQAGDTEAVRACGAEGVGLFRTEYLFINRETLPSEEEQYRSYRAVAEALHPAPVIIRTLDLGGDKFLSHLQVPTEMNPFLGWRAIRFCLQERDIFRAQLRAILRASTGGNVKMMYPMISGLEELQQANAFVEQLKAELHREGIPFNPDLEIGAMIEIPSAVLAADALAKRVKFFSIGTNDLIQYSLAVDRLNERIAHLYEPTHPAIVRLIHLTAEAGRRHGIWTGVCGEMAGDPLLTPLLLGLGVTELSAGPASIPRIKHLIRRLRLSEAQALARQALECESPGEILQLCRDCVRTAAPMLFESLSPAAP